MFASIKKEETKKFSKKDWKELEKQINEEAEKAVEDLKQLLKFK